MNEAMKTILSSIISMVGLGMLFATVLAIANRHLRVEEDPNIERIERILPGANCGACGFPNCRALAEAVVRGQTPLLVCPAGGEATSRMIAELLGIESKKVTKKIAVIHCGADESQRKKKAKYAGVQTCRAANIIFGAGLACKFGCLGFEDCVRACPFDAIKMVKGLPKVDPDKCTACGKCVAACPRAIISLEPFEKEGLMFVACNSQDKGALVKRICPVGCIGCGVCEKLSDAAFKVKENLARVDYGVLATKEIDWDLLVEKCPMNTIQRI